MFPRGRKRTRGRFPWGEGRAPCGLRGGADPGENIKQIFYPSGVQPVREEGLPFCGGGARASPVGRRRVPSRGGVFGMT